MPVARIITTSPAEVEELRRQLTAAGYSVKFAAPDEQFSDADVVVAAANVHRDYALQYASEVADEAGADVIVAPGVVAGSAERWERALSPPTQVPQRDDREMARAQESTAAAVASGTAQEVKSALSETRDGMRETLGTYSTRVGDAWQAFRQKRELAAEEKRLERERREMEREEQRRILQQQRLEAEARMAAERERLRVQRQAEQERLRREQEEMRRAMEEERARIAAERERLAHLQAPGSAGVSPATLRPDVTPVAPVMAAPVRPVMTPSRRPAVHGHHPVARRAGGRDQGFQKAAVVASVLALVAMVGFAIAMNMHPSSPMPHSMVQNPVQEKSPFGAASITPAATTVNPPAPAAPVTRAPLPQRDGPAHAEPAPKATKPSPSRTRRAARDNYVAEDEVIVHHYGDTAQKHPAAAQTQAGIRRYSDQ